MGAPVVIRGVEVEARADGDLDVTYRVETAAPALVPARTMCRVGDRNLIYPMAQGEPAGTRLSSLYRADPFDERATACQIDFLYAAPSDQTHWRPAGRACWQAGVLRDGACADASFPPPVLAAAGAVVLEWTALELHDSSAVLTALFTLTQPVEGDRRFIGTIRCDDSLGKVAGEAALAFVPLDQIPVGASVFGPLTFALERTPAADAQCAVEIVSRTVGSSGGGERIHAQYCVTTRSVRIGRC